ncbi:hypothetical protein D2V08_12900 [Flagellimonas lutimaris]|uniref:Transposase IS110-like N-terminal domain-containing protein n=1 Tax=Flagellimonas lutimaris TaxID=475082 RepID=A0A3A1N741_9FLAO|nr:transposase [Allomuricauda lutimaris]RIV31650.1 hypothetical protein D2V08_12900 [Allomuricauda lutimaris]
MKFRLLMKRFVVVILNPLESNGWTSLVINHGDIHRMRREKHTKTDRIDAQLKSRELKDGRLDGIHIPEFDREELRSLFRRRIDLVKDFRRIKSNIKMELLYFGIKEPEELDNGHWSHDYRKRFDDQVFRNPTAKAAPAGRMRFFRFVEQELRDVSTQLRRHCSFWYYL